MKRLYKGQFISELKFQIIGNDLANNLIQALNDYKKHFDLRRKENRWRRNLKISK